MHVCAIILTMPFSDTGQHGSNCEHDKDQRHQNYHTQRDNHHQLIHIFIICVCIHKHIVMLIGERNFISYVVADPCKGTSDVATL